MKSSNFPEEFLNLLGDNKVEFSILENNVDIDLQTEYFEFISKNKQLKSENIDSDIEKLFDLSTSISDKKLFLVQLAALDNVKSFRAIEKYCQIAEPELRDWATLAMNESRMIMESSLTNDKRVFISTGMGGMGNKLRYFCIFISKNDLPLNEFQQNLVQKELEFTLKKKKSELEEINFFESFISLTTLVPIIVPVQKILKNVIDDCNEFGNFLSEDFIISNVKKLNEEEIKDLIDKHFSNNDEQFNDDFFEIKPNEEDENNIKL
jgi:hypothetical protein